MILILTISYFQLTTPSGLLEPGLKRLHTVNSIFENFEFQAQLFVNPKFEADQRDAPFYFGTFEGNV